ncbi:hypothetical protein [Ethanoligenens harbinense]|uniref:Uncharacterized protein n=1 Tax=Ethanoligenens harbinense (strain DSM 18485 / JCM 12961 / CGMCC 1.5033 / YUAN-3) TaxID=663278 RepID=E6U5H7_ETHHY|nr:hypothetical protein [Ethanoligenens harbinense]ADU25644.1 hypothetical protein Ethha_0053 [Ethanoligenens harbinense YUAN-3]AVQ94819.1 hypothetical protein CXQ68_00265 [Ethanoligenens harbinense YUAN-3]AYF37509.1 hypothetical protein CXP51_00265 [Ethanoligenens harbinense]AYF40230.1 hypothetical protein CN246_00265 [Ethanoligenens harbinense]QCN91065.1 hypothetical protein DRA42_00275 [Ethanoligenens harbinense]
MTQAIDACAQSIARFGESQIGDAAKLFYGQDCVTAVLVDGGETMSGCVLSGMVTSMFGSALSHPVAVDEAVATVAGMLPVSGGREPVLLTVAQMRADGAAYLARLAMPQAVFLRRGRVLPLVFTPRRCGPVVLEEARLQLKSRDTLVCFGHGVARAGEGVPYAAGWENVLLPAYLQAAYTPSVPAGKLVELLLGISCSLCGEKPRSDLSAAVLRYRAVREG